MSTIQAVCHDHTAIVSGTITRADQQGCLLQSNVDSAEPLFARRGPVLLNIIDEGTKQSVTVKAKLTGFKRIRGTWIYQLRWKRAPEILSLAA